MRMRSAVSAMLGLLCWAASAAAYTINEWTWSVPVPSLEDRRAFLWIDPHTPRVRGLIVACQNMLEEPLFDRPAFRQAAAASGLGIVLIFSGHDHDINEAALPNHPARSYLDIFFNPDFPQGTEDPKRGGADLQKALDALAIESEHAEVRFAPLMPVGHSSAHNFVWHLWQWDPSRIFAMMPFKVPCYETGPAGIPIFDVNSEWFEYGTNPMGNCSLSSISGGAAPPRARVGDANVLYGTDIDVGSGHCDVSDDAVPLMALFLKKAVAARIPQNAPLDAPVPLLPVPLATGWALDPATFGKPEGKPIPFADWHGDPTKCFWYLDQEMAVAVQSHLAAQLAKKPTYLGFMDGGQVSTDARMAVLTPQFESDGVTFRLHAEYVDHIDHANLGAGDADFPNGAPIAIGSQPIHYRVNSGCVVQTGPDTFRACPQGGPLFPQGQPWEPTIVAYSLGDAQFRPTEHPAHIRIDVLNRGGQPQTLDFPKITDVSASALAPIRLQATASSGLPVQYYVVSGPASIQGDVLSFGPLPALTKWPLRIRVSAFQWGRTAGAPVQSAGPVTQEFFIRR